ncbi:hypothetical protein [Salipiger marinus]|uniref:hypothetical protein n=1 Tax=Salipiger marinus TaxID=555512 RepID=UPI0040581A37
MPDQSGDPWIDELERDLGQAAALRLLANAGGQRRDVPKRAAGSRLAEEVGLDVVEWLSDRFGGTALDIPGYRAREARDRAAELRAAILEAGLTTPNRSANVIAAEFGVTSAWVHKLRVQLRAELEQDTQLRLPFFDNSV